MFLQLRELVRSKRNRPFTFTVNCFGLMLAFTAVIVMFTYVYAEWHHDSDVIHRKDIVRAETAWGLMAGAYGPWLEEILPEVEQSCRIYCDAGMPIHIPAQQEVCELFTRKEVFLSDSIYPSMFSLHIVRGEAVYRPGGVLLSESAARQMFGESDPIGKVLVMKNNLALTVTALFKDVTNPALRRPCILADIRELDRLMGGNMTGEWNFANFETFFRLQPGTDREELREKFRKLYVQQLKELGSDEDWIKEAEHQAKIRNYDDLYFDEQAHGYAQHGNLDNMRILMIIALLVLGVSIINYVNMATAQVTDKARMIGVKRVLGAGRISLIFSITLDAVLTCILAMGLAWFLAKGVSPYLMQWTGLGGASQLDFMSVWSMLVGIPLICGCLAGIFPAFYLTRKNRLESTNSYRNESIALQRFKSSLMIVQFAVSIGLIISTLFIYKQVNYMKQLDPGYDRNNILVVHGNGEKILYNKYREFRQALLRSPAILKVGASKNPLYNIQERGFHLNVTGWNDKGAVYLTWVDMPFLDLMDLKITEGEGFHEEDVVVTGTGSGINQKFIINQQMAKEIASLSPRQDYLGGNRIGVVKDFNFKSMREPITPMYLGLLGGFNSVIDVYVRILPEQREQALQYIENCYRQFYPNTLYRYSFMDDDYNRLYGSEDLFVRRLLMFSILSVLIGCLGLLGFVVFFIEQKTKSIGLRKVMGATEWQIMQLLNRNFMRRMLIGFIIACPIVYYILVRWLSDFAYKTTLSWWVFVIAFTGIFLMTVAGISILTWKAATMNPIDSLKTE